jgi:DHA3 family tetracycline resistance protein-like MFS transporter
MPLPDRSRTNPYRLYLGMQLGMAFLTTLAFTTSVVYWVSGAGLNPFQLLMLGTVMEATYLLLQLPTGILADLVSRRWCVVAGVLVYAGGLVMQGLSPVFLNLLLAQVVVAMGAALMSGAQESWVADETRRNEMASVYLRATRLSFGGVIAGSLLSGVVATFGLHMPMLVSGVLMGVGGVVLAFLMPEKHFHRPGYDARFTTLIRRSGQEFGAQLRSSRRVITLVPGLILLFGMTFFYGLWSESFDRLHGAFLLEDITFPDVLGLEPAMWFSILACVVAVAGFFIAGWAGRRAERLGSSAIIGMLVLFTCLAAAGVVAMSLSQTFVVAVAFLLVVSAARPLYEPLVNGWLVVQVDSSVRATALSARDMFDSGGQITGGPLVGAIGSLVSIRAGLMAGALVLVPAVLFLLGARRRAGAAASAGEKTRDTPADATEHE